MSEEIATGLTEQINAFKNGLQSDTLSLNKLHKLSRSMSAEKYNYAVVSSKYGNASYDEVKNAMASAGKQEEVDALDRLRYNKTYKTQADYTAAIADIDAEIAKLKEELNAADPTGGAYARWTANGANDDDEHNTVWDRKSPENTAATGNYDIDSRNKYEYLKTLKSNLENAKKMTEFTELPAKLGEANMKVFESNINNYVKNPTVDDIVSWANTVDSMPDGGEKDSYYYDNMPDIQDPLGFALDNPDIVGQYHHSSTVGQLVDEYSIRGKEHHWNQIKDDEKLIYYYTLVTKGKDKALEYISLLEPTLGQRYQEELNEAFDKVLDEHGWPAYLGLNIASIPMKTVGGVLAEVDNIADYIGGNEINPYSSINTARLGANSIRGETAEDIAENVDFTIGGRNVLAEAYNIGMSLADSVVGGKLMGPAYSFISGSGAAADAAEDIYNRGGSADQVFWGSFAAGAAETVFEYVSIDRLLKNSGSVKGLKGYIKEFFKQGGSMLSEASEEYLQEVLTPVFKNYALHTDEEIDLLSPDALYAALLGGLSAGPMEVGGIAGEAIATNKQYGGYTKSAQQELLQMGLVASKDSKAFKLAEKYAANVESGKELNAQQVRNLTEAVVDETNKNRGKFVESVANKLTELGETGDTNSLAKAVVDQFMGVQLSEEQAALIKNSKAAESVAADIREAQEFTEKFKEAVMQESKKRAESAESVGFVGEKSGTEYTAEQAAVLAEIPGSVLQVAFGYVQQSGGDVPAKAIGIGTDSELYKNAESAGIADSDGNISGAAVVDELRRRIGEQKAKQQAALTAAAENRHADTAESTVDSAVNDGEAVADNISERDSTGDNSNNGKITVNMSESERAEILRDKTVTPVDIGNEHSDDFDYGA